jgi:FlaA1/EpsC-like NDP-sugar epimerase
VIHWRLRTDDGCIEHFDSILAREDCESPFNKGVSIRHHVIHLFKRMNHEQSMKLASSVLQRSPIELRPHAPDLHGTILVTGAGGSIGREVCGGLYGREDIELILLDHDETHLMDTVMHLTHSALFEGVATELADIRDETALARALTKWRPNIIIHAAALKHLSVLERFPEEAWKTNVLGTRNVLQLADQMGVDVVVNVSTDKAASPTSVLGASKYIAERLACWFGRYSNHLKTVSVRLANVFGSRGSVSETMLQQLQYGVQVTLTDANVSRIMMYPTEASGLILRAAEDGDLFGLTVATDVGTVVSIREMLDVYSAALQTPPVVRLVGLRPGEKLHERLFSDVERPVRISKYILGAEIPPLNPEELKSDLIFEVQNGISPARVAEGAGA